jgi:hypothetical protein
VPVVGLNLVCAPLFRLLEFRGGWKGKRLISDTPLVRGHAGGNSSLMDGLSRGMFSWGQVVTGGVSFSGLQAVITGPVVRRANK